MPFTRLTAFRHAFEQTLHPCIDITPPSEWSDGGSYQNVEHGVKRKTPWADAFRPSKFLKLNTDKTSKPVRVTRGTFGLEQIYGAQFPGEQGCATALCSVLQATQLEPARWTPGVIDKVVLQGDYLHTKRVQDLGKDRSAVTHHDRTLRLEEFPNELIINLKIFVLNLESKAGYTIQKNRLIVDSARELSRVIQTQLDTDSSESSTSCGVLVQINNKTLGVFKDSNYSYLFDPVKSSNRFIQFRNHSKAVLAKFHDIVTLCTYLVRKLCTHRDVIVSVTKVGLDLDIDLFEERLSLPVCPAV